MFCLRCLNINKVTFRMLQGFSLCFWHYLEEREKLGLPATFSLPES